VAGLEYHRIETLAAGRRAMSLEDTRRLLRPVPTPSKRPGAYASPPLGVRLDMEILTTMDHLIRSGRILPATRNAFVCLAVERLLAEYAGQLGDKELLNQMVQRQAFAALLQSEREAHALESILLGFDATMRPLLECGEIETARRTLADMLTRIGAPEPGWKERIRSVLEHRYPQLMREP